MSTQSPNIVLAATTPAQHYNWIAAVSAALDTLGITRTADTGQINLVGQTTIALPTGEGASGGNFYNSTFEIRKLSAVGFADIFIRIDYGIYYNYGNQGASAAEYFYPAMTITLGSATNGAGVLTSFKANTGVPTFQSTASSGYASTWYAGSSALNSHIPSINPQQCDFASDGQNYLSMMIGENAPVYENYSIFNFALERTLDPATGIHDNAGCHAFCGQTGGNSVWMYADFANVLQWSGTTGMPSIAPPFNIGVDVSTVDLFPLIGSTLVPKGAPSVSLAYYASGVNSPVTFPATLYSAAQTYKACPRSTASADPYNTGTKLALRFD